MKSTFPASWRRSEAASSSPVPCRSSSPSSSPAGHLGLPRRRFRPQSRIHQGALSRRHPLVVQPRHRRQGFVRQGTAKGADRPEDIHRGHHRRGDQPAGGGRHHWRARSRPQRGRSVGPAGRDCRLRGADLDHLGKGASPGHSPPAAPDRRSRALVSGC